jgi:hypothetical protein
MATNQTVKELIMVIFLYLCPVSALKLLQLQPAWDLLLLALFPTLTMSLIGLRLTGNLQQGSRGSYTQFFFPLTAGAETGAETRELGSVSGSFPCHSTSEVSFCFIRWG